jgi:hypothetical protein
MGSQAQEVEPAEAQSPSMAALSSLTSGHLCTDFRKDAMGTLRAFFLVLAATVIAGPPLAAHHGRGATFDMKKQLTLKGTVSQARWQNPHVLISIDVKDEGGNVVTWTFENSNTHTLATH